MLKYSLVKVIDVNDWDELVIETYGKPYNFQQQEGCQSRGMIYLIVPPTYNDDACAHDKIPIEINGGQMGVKFQVWLDTTVEDINAKFEKIRGGPEVYAGQNDLFWERNFYPDLNVLAEDLYKKGLIEAGKYQIKIDW